MGLMGALLVALVKRRGAWPEPSRRALVGNVIVLLIAQVTIGLLMRVVDNFAHVGGLIGGCAAAALLLPEGVLRGRSARAAVALSLCALAVTAAASTVALAR